MEITALGRWCNWTNLVLPYATNNPESTVFDLKRKNITPCKMLRNPLLKFPIYFPTRTFPGKKANYLFSQKIILSAGNTMNDLTTELLTLPAFLLVVAPSPACYLQEIVRFVIVMRGWAARETITVLAWNVTPAGWKVGQNYGISTCVHVCTRVCMHGSTFGIAIYLDKCLVKPPLFLSVCFRVLMYKHVDT